MQRVFITTAFWCHANRQESGEPQSRDQPPSPPAPEPTNLTPYHLDVERKHITVLACWMAATETLMERLLPENLHHRMHGIFDTAWRQVPQYEGLMHHVTDDGFVALFGVPQSHEDHAQRALLAAIHLQQRLATQALAPGSLEDKLDLRIGQWRCGGEDDGGISNRDK